MSRALGAILVGGRGARMGGAPKGLLASPTGETLVARTARLFTMAGLDVVLVGDRAEYATLGHVCIRDDPRAAGPLAGLLAALSYAGDRHLVTMACDMPFVTEELLARLLAHPSLRPIVAARRGGRFEPLFARHDASRVLPLALERAATGDHSLTGLLVAAGADGIDVTVAERPLLDDWDTPEDIARRGDVADVVARDRRSPR